MPDIPRALTVRQIADRYAVDVHAVLAWIHRGELRAVDVSAQPGSGRPRWRIPPDAIMEWEASREAQRPAARTPRRGRRKGERPGFVRYFS